MADIRSQDSQLGPKSRKLNAAKIRPDQLFIRRSIKYANHEVSALVAVKPGAVASLKPLSVSHAGRW